MELNLTSAQKLQALQGSAVALSNEIYSLLLRMGFDPDTFEVADLDALEPLSMQGMDGEVTRLRKLVQSYEVVKAKVTALL